MSQLRQDRTSGRWVIIAPRRGHRPGALVAATPPTARPRVLTFDPACPFCPGHENQLPGIVAEIKSATPPGWIVRVVPNKFPALQAVSTTEADDQHCVAPGYGFHEVIVENSRHDADLTSLADTEIEAVVSMYLERSEHLLEQPGIESVILFRNHGPKGGASQAHPHAQILAAGFVPSTVRQMADWGQRYHAEHGRCPTCDDLAFEGKLKVRVVEDARDFLVLVPFAAEHPFETWIVPKQHQPSFAHVASDMLTQFGHLLRRTLDRLRSTKDDPPYNFVIDSADRAHLRSPYVHWRLRIAPDLATWGGFELGAGTAINPSSPEDDAAMLRAHGTAAAHENRTYLKIA